MIYPAGNTKLQDGASTTGVENYKEFWYCAGGPERASARASTATGRSRSSSSATAARRCARRPVGDRRHHVKPACGCWRARRCRRWARARRSPAEEPPYQPLVPCDKQALPEFNGPLRRAPRTERVIADDTRAARHSHEGGLGVREQIERYRSAFIAVVTMIVLAAAVGGYILAHENLKLPGWVPVLGRNYYTLKADFQTAQAVTPGQGQAVTIAGAKVGEVESVELHGGRRHVTMKVTPEVRALLQERDAAAASQDAAAGHHRRGQPRAHPRPGSSTAAKCCRCRRRRRTSTSTNSSPGWTPKRASTCRRCWRARRGASSTTAPPSRRRSSASARPRATPRRSPSSSKSATRTSPTRSTTSGC